MSFLLRGLKKNRWLSQPEWVSPGDAQANVLSDLVVRDNALSFWRVRDDRSDLDDAVLAVALTKASLEHVDYALLPERCIDALGIDRQVSEGRSPLGDANDRHVDLLRLSVDAVARLARTMRSEAAFGRRTPRAIKALVATALDNKRISVALLNDNVRSKLGLRQ